MPSFLDTLQSSDDEPGGDAPLDVLGSVKAEGARRRRARHRRNAALSGLVLALVAVPTFAAIGGSGGGEDVRSTDLAGATDDGGDRESGAADVERTTTSTTAPTEVLGVQITPVPEAPLEEEAAPTPTTARPPRPTVPPTTAPPLVCENSYDPACGDFYWDPAPAPNQEMTHTVVGPTSVVAGQTLVFDVVFNDPDAQPGYFDDDTDGVHLLSACATEPRFGPWTPPAPAAGSGTHPVTYQAPEQPGTYFVNVVGSSRNGDCQFDPYGDELVVQIVITVTAG